MGKQKGQRRKNLVIASIFLACAVILIWWVGPRRIPRIIPDEVVTCQVLYIDLTNISDDDFSGEVVLEQEETSELVYFLGQHDLSPLWKFSSFSEMEMRYTLLFYDEKVLRAKVIVTDRGEVTIGSWRHYQLSNWTSGDAEALYQLIMLKK